MYVTYSGKKGIIIETSSSDKFMLFRWCHDIGYGQAAHKLLLKTVFEVHYLYI